MTITLTVEIPDAVVQDIDQAIAEGRFPDRDSAIQSAIRVFSEPELARQLRYRTRPPSMDELRARREEILAIASKRGAYNVRIYGSVARGDADAGSDVDFLVDMEEGRSLFDLGGLLMDLQTLLGVPVDVGTSVRPRMREQVEYEAIIL